MVERFKSHVKIPNCPYHRLPCLRFNRVLREGVCQPYRNSADHSDCVWLPTWDKKTGIRRIAKLRGGRLYV